MQIIKAIILLAANFAVVHSCKCWPWGADSPSSELTELACRNAAGTFDGRDCHDIGNSMWAFARACWFQDSCSDCKHGCH
ncbi:hypothetical protein BDV23DRAFT_49546 [Aspergillus alliaceus]|uniref:Uncharacterized protein n=1 Tax=Petromyces alliaceus TaxID=209559 RepID=A0A5N7BQD9_PETAA|nr:hypothetical protein BDV23DRAFT_49546 [Aspergillus alliaceus]